MENLDTLINELKNFEKVIIYGAGRVGKVVVQSFFRYHRELDIYSIAVSNVKDNPDDVLSIPVVAIEDLVQYAKESVVIIATLEIYHENISGTLKELGFNHVIPITEALFKIMRKEDADFTVDVLQYIANLSFQVKKIENKLQLLENKLQRIGDTANYSKRLSNETIWASVFNQVTEASEWLKDTKFTPGRWAVGYPYLYVMYRILNEMHPNSILELGMGQTTHMITQYVDYYHNIDHSVVEHDQGWIDFYTNRSNLSECTEVIKLEIDFQSYKEEKEIPVYCDCKESLEGRMFDFISIDGPISKKGSQFSRIDILRLLPKYLKKSFIIMLDDYDRTGERNMARELEEILAINKIEYKTGIYSGEKDVYLCCSSDLSFFSTL